MKSDNKKKVIVKTEKTKVVKVAPVVNEVEVTTNVEAINYNKLTKDALISICKELDNSVVSLSKELADVTAIADKAKAKETEAKVAKTKATKIESKYNELKDIFEKCIDTVNHLTIENEKLTVTLATTNDALATSNAKVSLTEAVVGTLNKDIHHLEVMNKAMTNSTLLDKVKTYFSGLSTGKYYLEMLTMVLVLGVIGVSSTIGISCAAKALGYTSLSKFSFIFFSALYSSIIVYVVGYVQGYWVILKEWFNGKQLNSQSK